MLSQENYDRIVAGIKFNRQKLINELVNVFVDRYKTSSLIDDIPKYLTRKYPRISEYAAEKITNDVYMDVRDDIRDLLNRRQIAKHNALIRNARILVEEKYKKIKQTPARYKSSFMRLPAIKALESQRDKDMIWNEYVQKWTEHQADIPQRAREQNMQIAQEFVNNKVEDITQPPNRYKSSFMSAPAIRILSNEDKELLWNDYVTKWTAKHPQLHETFRDKLKRYLVNNHENLLSLDEFKRIASNWATTSKSLDEWYNTYVDEFYKQPSTSHSYTQPSTNTIGFKSRNKIDVLKTLYPEKSTVDNSLPTSHFPLKDNIKRYQLHKVSPKGTYIIDLMFVDKLCYLVAINVNTRYLFVNCMNQILFKDNESDESKAQRFGKRSKNALTFVNKLRELIDNGMDAKYIQGDGEKAFASKLALAFYISRGIQFKAVPRMQLNVYPDFMPKPHKDKIKTDPMHGSLGILDRVVRTLRDMAYNMKVGIITPGIMEDLVNQYNNAPHTTLSKYAGFEVSPQMVQDDEELENYIIRQIMKENDDIMNRHGFMLKNGSKVKIYNEKDSMSKRRSVIQPGNHHIIGYHGGYYEVEDESKNKQMIPRYKLDPLY